MIFAALQQRHEALLARQDALSAEDLQRRTPAVDALAGDARQFVSDVIAQSSGVVDPRERDLLRAYLRYWATFIYEWTGVFPKTDLRPAEIEAPAPTGSTVEPLPRPDEPPDIVPSRGGLPGWAKLLAGLLAFLLIGALGLALLLSLNDDFPGPPSPTSTSPPTPSRPDEGNPTEEPPGSGTEIPPGVPIDGSNATEISPLYEAEAHEGDALAVAFDPAGQELATGGTDGRARIWLVPDLEPIRELADQTGWVRTVAYSPAFWQGTSLRQFFLTGGNDRQLRLYDFVNLQLFAEYVPTASNSGFVFAADFSPDGALMASGHGDGITRLWNVATGIECQDLECGGAQSQAMIIQLGGPAVNDVAFSGDGLTLVVATADAFTGVQVIETATFNIICTVSTGPMRAVDYSPTGNWIAAGGNDGQLLLIRAEECDDDDGYGDYPAHAGGVTGVAFSPTGEWLVSVGRDGWLKIWTPSGDLLAEHQVGAPVNGVAVSPDAQYIATVDDGGRLLLWGIP